MENEAMADQILALLEQLLQQAGPEWVMEFLMAGMEAAQEGDGAQMAEPPMQMPSMPAARPQNQNAFAAARK